jgi:DNA-binding MarR family transcriptional regulator
VLFWLLERHGYSQKIRDLADRLRLNVKLTPSVEFQIARNKEKVILYPPGAQLLDEATVNEPLMWLENYPTAAEPFERALKLYLEGDSSGNRNLLDNLRFAIEQLLREVLENTKSLEQQKRPLLTWLGSEHRVHQQVVNMYEKLLFGDYTRYQNDAVKHSEGCSEEEIEFMIYLTGTFMRLIIKLSESNRVVVSS